MGWTQGQGTSARRFDALEAMLGLGIVLGLSALAAGVMLVASLDGWAEPGGRVVIGRDFANLWTAGVLVWRGDVDILPSFEGYIAAQRALFGLPVMSEHNWSYPPHTLPVAALLALLPYPVALAVWSAGGVLAIAAAVLPGLDRRMQMLALAALVPLIAVNWYFGQNGLYTAALAVGAWRLLDRAPLVAGCLLALLTIKPQLGLMIAAMLLIERRWSVIAVACVATALLIGLSILLFGVKPWIDWLTIILPFQSTLTAARTDIPFYMIMMPTLMIGLSLAGVPETLAQALHALQAVAAVALVFGAVLTRDRKTAWVAAFTAGLMLSPYLFLYDVGVMIAALIVLLRERPPLTPTGNAVVLMAFLLPILTLAIPLFVDAIGILANLALPVVQPAPFVLIATLAWVVLGRRARVVASGEAEAVGDVPDVSRLPIPQPAGLRA